jgi:hypothetical protein
MKNKTLILNTIQELLEKGGSGNFAIFALSEDYYIQMSLAKHAEQAWCEAVSNQFLEGAAKISEIKIQRLIEMNWNAPSKESPNFYQIHRVDSVSSCEALADLLRNTAYNVYECRTIEEAGLNLVLE